MSADIKKYSFKEGLSQEFETVDLADFFGRNFEKLTTVHRAGFYEIIWFHTGNVTIWVDFEPIQIEANAVLFLDKDVVKRIDNVSTPKGRAILFTDGFYCRTEADTRYLRNSILFNDLFSIAPLKVEMHVQWLTGLFDQMSDELGKKKDAFQDDILKNLLHNFLLQSERIKRTQDFAEVKKGVDLDYTMRLKELLDQGYKTQKQVAHYAGKLNITEKRLNQATGKVLGKTPKEIIDDRVNLEARRMLGHTKSSVKEIGFSLGFEEPTNFIKYFKKHNGATPSEFRSRFSTE